MTRSLSASTGPYPPACRKRSVWQTPFDVRARPCHLGAPLERQKAASSAISYITHEHLRTTRPPQLLAQLSVTSGTYPAVPMQVRVMASMRTPVSGASAVSPSSVLLCALRNRTHALMVSCCYAPNAACLFSQHNVVLDTYIHCQIKPTRYSCTTAFTRLLGRSTSQAIC